MLETRALVTHARLDPSEFRAVLSNLSSSGWHPALLESERTFLKHAGVGEVSLQGLRRAAARAAGAGPVAGDLIFRDGDVYYLILRSTCSARESAEGESSSELEIGIISPSGIDSSQKLKHFAGTLEHCVRVAFQQSSAGFEWRDHEDTAMHLERLTRGGESRASGRMTPARFSVLELEAARMLAQKPVRELLAELHRAGFARERDIRSRQSNTQDVDRILGDLQSLGLITAEYLLECRQTGQPLARLQNMQQLHGAELGGFVCPNCSAKFSDENVSALFALSEIGRQLSQSGHWLRLWITGLLNKHGVPVTSILWSRDVERENCELVVEYLGQLWLVTVKDEEFSPEDAYRINYRQAHYRADRSIAVTTELISKSAKRVIEDAARQPSASATAPLYIEGLDSAEAIFEKEVSAAALQHARRVLEPLEEVSGWHLGPLMAEWLSGALQNRAEEFHAADYREAQAV